MKSLLVSLVLIASLGLSAGCGLLPEIDTSPSPTAPATENTTPIDTEWTIPPAEGEATALANIADVVARVKPSVVAINTKFTDYDLFNRPFTQEAAGSGWIIDKDGIIVTNNHVVEGAESITVTLDDGRTFPAVMNTVATDFLTDLAVFRINAQDLPAASVGDSSRLRVGDWVVAIGNSLGQGISATTGIVSALGVSLAVSEGQTLYDLIQTDAAINPGNSGGPLVNLAGEVVGMNSVKRAQVDVEGVGYAISTREAIPTVQELITAGYVTRPFLGVQGLLTVDQAVASYFDLSVDQGVLIRGILSGGPADTAGLEAGDVITRFGGQEVTDVSGLVRAIHSFRVGQSVEITFWRGGTESTTSVILTESPQSS